MLIYLTVLIAAVTIFKPEGIQSQQQCRPSMNGNDADDFNYSRVSCNFEDDHGRLCGWKNIDEGYQMTWTTESFEGNYYAHLDFTNYYRGNKGGLASTWLDPKPCHTCQLQFKYYIELDSWCQLSLIYETAQRDEVLWTTRDASGSPFSEPICVDILCSQDRYRMVMEGERLWGYSWPCGYYWNEIDVDDIVYRWSPDENCPSTTTHSTTTTLPQTTTTTATSSSRHTTSVSSSVKTSTNSVASPSTTTKITVLTNDSTSEPLADSNTGGLDTGPLAGIIVAVIVVIVIVVVVVVLVVLRRGKTDGLQSKGLSKASTSTASHSRAVTNSAYYSGDRPELAVLGNAPDRFKGDNADTNHVLTAPDNHYVNVSNDNDSPHRGYELVALPGSSNDAGAATRADSSTNRYTRLRLKGSKGTALSDQVDDDTYDHAEARQGNEHPTAEDEYTVPHQNRKFKPSVPAKGNTVSKSAAAKGSTVYENAAVESSIAHQNAAGENYGRVRVLADRKQGGDGDYSLANNVHASDAAEAAAAYALAGTTDYETVDDDGTLVTSPSSASGDVYNRLNAKGGPAVGQKVLQNHYDHINGPAGTGAEYSSLGLEEKTRYLQREMAEGDYSHI